MNSAQPVPFAALNCTAAAVFEAMGYKDNLPDAYIVTQTNALLTRVAHACIPSIYYQLHDCEITADAIRIRPVEFNTGPIIANSLKHTEKIAIFVATAGPEFDVFVNEIKAEGDCVSMFIVDSIGTCVVEQAGDYMERLLEKKINEKKHTNRFSPGYCGWHLTEQQKLFSLLPPTICNIHLSDSCLMSPIKSISGVIGIGNQVRTKIYSCQICELKSCFRRKIK